MKQPVPFLLALLPVFTSVVTLNGGYLTISAAVTTTQIDLQVTYEANVAWLGIIFSPDEVNADMHVLSANSSNPASPISLIDCYLDQSGFIQRDDVGNFQPSLTGNTSSTAGGLYAAYSRDLATDDPSDRELTRNQIITLCFISSTAPFQGGGFERNLTKVCSMFSLHQNVPMGQDRLLGNFAGTATLNSNNLTVYATEATRDYSLEPWLYLTVLNQQQGLSTFSAKWLGVSYRRSMLESDMAGVECLRGVQVHDLYSTGHIAPLNDSQYAVRPGSNDLVRVLGGCDASRYVIASFARKYVTGDLNRDQDIQPGNNTFCFAAGEDVVLTPASYHIGLVCLNFTLAGIHTGIFRDPLANNSRGIIEYVEPTNTVTVEQFAARLVLATALFFFVLFA